MPSKKIIVSTPGRICLFGEHQDYLQLPVIPCAISLRITLAGEIIPQPWLYLDLPDIGEKISLPLTSTLEYVVERDYIRSVINVMRRKGFSFSYGFKGGVHGEIPINSGTSSSSALIATWIALLALISDQAVRLTPHEIARLAHEAEVLEFNEPGGMMDHFSTAYGGILHIRFHPDIVVEELKPSLGAFILGDSHEPKDTKGILARVKNGVLRIAGHLSAVHSGFSLQTVSLEDLDKYTSGLGVEEISLLRGTLKNRDMTQTARRLMLQSRFEHEKFGRLLNDHQEVLRDVLRISTPKIDRMIDAALTAGALGGKINGSGGGGCMFVYAPENTGQVAEAIEGVGGKAYIVTVAPGTMLDA